MEGNDLLVIELVCGFSMLFIAFIGALMFFKPASYKNEFYGYRSKRAFENEEAWFFAQKFSGKWLCISTLVLVVVRLVLFVFKAWNVNLEIALSVLWILLIIGVVVLTEKKLKTSEFNLKKGTK